MKKYIKPETNVFDIDAQSIIAMSSPSFNISNSGTIEDESQIQKGSRRSAWDEYEGNW